jgi:excisionase family DNA binding protein
MTAAQHETVMQAEDSVRPHENGGSRYAAHGVQANATSAEARDFYTVAEIATKTRFNACTIRRAIASGALLAHKPRHEFRVKTADYDQWVSGALHAPNGWSAPSIPVFASSTTDYRW